MKSDLPTPKQEQQAILALLGLSALVILGAAALLGGIALGLVAVAKWLFGQ